MLSYLPFLTMSIPNEEEYKTPNILTFMIVVLYYIKQSLM